MQNISGRKIVTLQNFDGKNDAQNAIRLKIIENGSNWCNKSKSEARNNLKILKLTKLLNF